MLNFTNITSAGFTVNYPDSTTKDVVSSYNNATQDGFLYSEALIGYQFNSDYIIATGYDTATHSQITPSTIWVINHELGKTVVVTVDILYSSEESIVYPATVQLVDLNQTIIRFTTARAGIATIR